MGPLVMKPVNGVPPLVQSESRAFEPFVDAKAVSSFLAGGFHWKSIQRMARDGRIPAYGTGGERKKWLFLLSEVQEWIKNGDGVLSEQQ